MTDIEKVRLLITDTESNIFTNTEIQAFIDLNSINDESDVRLAAANALEVMATDNALVQKKISTLDLSTDGPALAQSLREGAKRLRNMVEEDVAFDYAEIGYNAWTIYNIIWNEQLRTY